MLTNSLRVLLIFFCVVLAFPISAQEETVTGTARVIDSDAIVVDDQRIMLWGIDSLERPQTCSINGRIWGCRDAAIRLLETLSGRATVSCTLIGEPDVFGRRFGVCESGGQDINAEMVRQGLALAYTEQSDDYLDEQIEAIEAQIGLWQPGVNFIEPWIYRQGD